MLSIIADRSSRRLEDVLFDRIKERIAEMRSGKSGAERIILVVPAQFTLKAEELAFERLGGPGFFDFHIMSGNKLEQEIVREMGGPGLTPVNTLGRTMLLRKAALDNVSKLKRFSKLATNREFLKLAGDFVLQLKQNALSPEDIDALLTDLDPKSLLYEKLSDMTLIAKGYEEAIAGRFTDSEDLLAFITAKIPESSYIKGSEIWYHGFYSFTKMDCGFLAALAKHSHGLTMMLPLGEGCSGDEELFAAPKRTLSMLRAAAQSAGEKVLLERLPAPETQIENVTAPILISCSTPFTQAETVAAEILRLEREEGFSLGEMAVLTADAPGRTDILARVLGSFGVPVFMDSKRSVMHSPAAALVSALLDMSAEGLKPASVTSFIKQGLVRLAPEDGADPDDPAGPAEEFENYVRQFRLRGKAFLTPLRYGKDRYSEEEFEALEGFRSRLAEILTPFLDGFKEAKTCEEKCRALYNYLDQILELPAALEALAASLSEDGMPDAAEETAQAWKSICSLLDQAVTLMGDQQIGAKEFRDMIEDALSDISIGVLPQAEGRVQLGTVTRSRLQGVRALFVCDVNDGLIPSDAGRETLLTETELKGLEDMGYTLSKRSEVLTAEERLAVHQALAAPVERLYLSWCSSAENEEALKPSPLIVEYQERFPQAAVLYDVENRPDRADLLQSGTTARRRIFTELRRAADQGRGEDAVPPLWREVYNDLKARRDPAASAAEQALFYDISSPALSEQQVRGLFEQDGAFSFSASRLENFSSCPFKHFIQYGLSPDEQEVFEIDGAAVGSVHHEALLRLSRMLSAPARDNGLAITDPASLWMTVTDDQLTSMLDGILEELKETGFGGLLTSGGAESYRTGRIRGVCLQFARQMVEQVRRGRISAMYFETGFGRNRKFPPVRVETSLGTVNVEGRIDRIDMLKGENGEYVKVIDYKSGSTTFDRGKIVKGLSLQLSTYLEGALGDGKSRPAGMFYFQIKEPSAEADLADVISGRLPQKILETVREQYRLSGMVVDEPDVLAAIDRKIPEEGRSDIIGYKTSDRGKVTCKDMVTAEELEGFRADFRRTLKGICGRLTAGEISPRPRSYDSQTDSCTWCAYKAICMYGLKDR